MKTYGLPLSASNFLIIHLEHNPIITASLVQNFSHVVSIISFENSDNAWEWLHLHHTADLIIANDRIGGLDLLGKMQAGKANTPFPPVILTAKFITPELQAKAHLLQALDVFSTESDREKLKFRIDYLIQKKAYLTNAPQLVYVDLPSVPSIQIPLWKRSLDVIVSLSVLTALSPVLVMAAVLIFIESPGPVLYRSKRVGRDFKVFDMYKFRSMKPNADKLLAEMAVHNIYSNAQPELTPKSRCETCQRIGIPCERPLFLQETPICEKEHLRTKNSEAMFMKFRNDPRVTRLGNLLRNSSIDELPQLFNILRGDMSLVGNRPLPAYEAERLTTAAYVQRFAAPAGLTGLWQVTKRAKFQGVVTDLERIQLDIEYAEKFSFLTDLSILLKTVTAVWQKENV